MALDRQTKIRNIKWQVLALCGGLVFFSCANIVQPSGGPKDAEAPKVLAATPANQSVNFTSKKIVFTFDEYIQLQDINNQFFISPPLKNTPDFVVKNKELIVTLKDTLKPHTTYNINFGDAIKDLNEGNVLKHATYAFSTGSYIDSLSLIGNVKNAFSLSAEKDVLIMLYDEVVDSLPMKKLPTYYTKCDESGNFRLDNLKSGQYKLVALGDKNRNLLYDLPDEETIGFLDSLVSPEYIEPPKAASQDSLQTDSLATDSIKEGLATQDSSALSPKPSLQVWTFIQEKSAQYLKKSFAVEYGKLAFVYNIPVQKLDIGFLNIEIEGTGWAFREFSELRDTVYLWVPDAEDEEGEGVIPHVDTLQMWVQADGLKKDTVEIVLKKKGEVASATTGKGGGMRKSTPKLEDFKLTLSAPGKDKVQHPDKGFEVKANHPIIYSTLEQLELREDSTLVKFKIRPNPETLRSFFIDYNWKAGKTYSLFAPPNTFRDLFALGNDSFKVSFKGGDVEEFANLILKMDLPDPEWNYVVQLLDDKGKMIDERSIQHNETITFPLLQPGAYQLKLIYDENRNGKWDTGNYMKQRQPEKIVAYPEGTLTIRPNWDLEIEWDLGKPDKLGKRKL